MGVADLLAAAASGPMGALAQLIDSAGPMGGWVISGLLGTTLLYLYATDRLVSAGRHAEQAKHFQHQLEQQRDHYEEQLADLRQRLEDHHADKVYWRDVSLDMMGTVAASVGKDAS